jgi:hypothetical protein
MSIKIMGGIFMLYHKPILLEQKEGSVNIQSL